MSDAGTLEIRKSGDTGIIDITGDLTSASEKPLMDAYELANQSSPRAIALNFSNLDYMNSGGIGLLVTLLVRVNRQKQQLRAFGLSDHYKQIFELTRLDEAIGIHADEESALSEMG